MDDLIKNYHFQVEWGGAKMGFTKVSGLNFDREVIEYRNASDKEMANRKLPGRVRYGNIVLKRGMTRRDNEFFQWWRQVTFEDARRDVVISLLNEQHEPIVVWKIRNAFPVKLACSDLDAQGNEVVIESLEIAHDGLILENE